VTIDGAKQQVAGAWVVVGPPDFVPPIHSYRTMYDSLVDVIVREMDIPADDGLFCRPARPHRCHERRLEAEQHDKDFSPSFTRDIAPILSAIVRLERVHQHQIGPRARFHGSIGGLNFNALGGAGSLQAISRRSFRASARSKCVADTANTAIPDAVRIWRTISKQQTAGVTQMIPPICIQFPKLPYRLLRAWQRGAFVERLATDPGEPACDHARGARPRSAGEHVRRAVSYPGMEASWLFVKKEAWENRSVSLVIGPWGTIPVPGEGRR